MLKSPYTDLLNDDFDSKYSIKIKAAGPKGTVIIYELSELNGVLIIFMTDFHDQHSIWLQIE